MKKKLDLVNLYRDLGYLVDFVTRPQESFIGYLYDICPPKPGMNVCEAGCGSGKLGLAYAAMGAIVDLMDVDENALAYARRLWDAFVKLKGIDWPFHYANIFWDYRSIHDVRRPITTIPPYKAEDFGENSQDLVFNEGVPQHWIDEEHRQGAIDNMAWLTKPGGKVIVIGNNGHNPRAEAEDERISFTYEGMGPTRKCFKLDELGRRLKQAGLADVRINFIAGKPETAELIVGTGVKPE